MAYQEIALNQNQPFSKFVNGPLQYVDVKIESYPNFYESYPPIGTDSYRFTRGGYFHFLEASNPPRHLLPSVRLSYYMQRFYPPYGSSPSGIEIFMLGGIIISAWGEF